ncbi:MAG: hypothetical protein EZS28_039113 [Streblomastix strix]|uniref:Uncharacterized protein n=1 Tax=Streblomastix strix TaxID=222440 RepID=A0A5J4U5A5_9EUKA|nr:MAG: hypothetical protein EZS28_039113 [Streblomastix strix]
MNFPEFFTQASICTGKDDDAIDCVCPTTPEELKNIPKSKCECIFNDLRGSCKYCIGEPTDDDECICPTLPALLETIPKRKCDCVKADLRTDCQPIRCVDSTIPEQGCICTSTFHQQGCICPSLGLELEGIPLTVCECIEKGDLRSECTSGSGFVSVRITLSLIVVSVIIPTFVLIF